LDVDHLLLLDDLDVVVVLQVPRFLRLHAVVLDGLEHVVLLHGDRIREHLHPVEVVAHPDEHVRELDKGFDRRVPVHALGNLRDLTLLRADPPCRLDDVRRRRGGRQQRRKHDVRVERNRPHDLFELAGAVPVVTSPGRQR